MTIPPLVPSIAKEALLGAHELVIKESQGTCQDYLKKRELELDEFIIAQEVNGQLKYAAGEVHLVSVPGESDQFHLLAEFYFKDKQDQWVKKCIKGENTPVAWVFTPETQTELKTKGKVTFDYERPA